MFMAEASFPAMSSVLLLLLIQTLHRPVVTVVRDTMPPFTKKANAALLFPIVQSVKKSCVLVGRKLRQPRPHPHESSEDEFENDRMISVK